MLFFLIVISLHHLPLITPYINIVATNFIEWPKYEGYFFKDLIGREIRTTVRIRWSFAQMCWAMSLVCPSVVTHHTCRFWARCEPVNMPKTIVSRQTWSACCNSIPLFRQSDEEYCPQVLSIFMTMLGRILQLQHRGSWSIFDGKCLITHHHPPILGSLWFSSLYSYETVVGGQHFGTKSCRPAQHKELAESICGWLLWRGYLKVIVYFHSYGE